MGKKKGTHLTAPRQEVLGIPEPIWRELWEEVERARALLAAWEEGAARGVAAVEFEGAMIDGPALRMAREVIERGGGEG